MDKMYKVGTLVRHKETPGLVGIVLSGTNDPWTGRKSKIALYKVKWIPSATEVWGAPLRQFWHRELEVYENE
jgi:hypothetical protein